MKSVPARLEWYRRFGHDVLEQTSEYLVTEGGLRSEHFTEAHLRRLVGDCIIRPLTKRKRQICVHAFQRLLKIGTARTWISMMTMAQPKPDYKRGDVILVLFPHSDLGTGRIDVMLGSFYEYLILSSRRTGSYEVLGLMPTTSQDSSE